MDSRIDRMADVIVTYSVKVKPGDWVVIRSSFAGEPLADACARAVLRAGGNPTVEFNSSTVAETLLREASEEQLAFVSPVQETVIGRTDVLISLLAPTNTRALSGIPSERLAMADKARSGITQVYMDRWARGELDWTIAQFPTQAAAQDAGMSLRDYEAFVYGAALLDASDPVAAWQKLGERQQHVVDWLAGASELHLTGPETDLRVGLDGRTWLQDDGRGNFPGGEIYTSPVENRTEGTIQFNFPAVFRGREVDGIRLSFKEGRVVEATARTDEEYLRQMLALDDGASILGEFAIGTNPGIQRFTKNTLFDEKIEGTVHMALGHSVPDTGGSNVSALHWDIVYNLRHGGEVRVDGKLFSRNGEVCV